MVCAGPRNNPHSGAGQTPYSTTLAPISASPPQAVALQESEPLTEPEPLTDTLGPGTASPGEHPDSDVRDHPGGRTGANAVVGRRSRRQPKTPYYYHATLDNPPLGGLVVRRAQCAGGLTAGPPINPHSQCPTSAGRHLPCCRRHSSPTLPQHLTDEGPQGRSSGNSGWSRGAGHGAGKGKAIKPRQWTCLTHTLSGKAGYAPVPPTPHAGDGGTKQDSAPTLGFTPCLTGVGPVTLLHLALAPQLVAAAAGWGTGGAHWETNRRGELCPAGLVTPHLRERPPGGARPRQVAVSGPSHCPWPLVEPARAAFLAEGVRKRGARWRGQWRQATASLWASPVA